MGECRLEAHLIQILQKCRGRTDLKMIISRRVSPGPPGPGLQLLPSLSVWGWSSVVAENDNLSVTNYFIFSDL